jgi:predicted glycosyltransferase
VGDLGAAKRLMIYSQDGMGLGHMRRTFNVAREVLARDPTWSILVVSDSPTTPFFAPLAGMDYLKLPTMVKTGSRSWVAGGLGLEIDETVRMRSRLIVEAFAAFRPDVVLVDHMPLGVAGELAPLLHRARELGGRTRLFLGLRDVLDAPEVIRDVWTQQGAYAALARYDAVLVYGSREVFDAAAAYNLGPYARRLVYCNYVVSPGAAQAVARRRLGAGDGVHDGEPLVAVMGGGGADAFPLADTFLRALPLVRREVRVRGAILAGPNMPTQERERLAWRGAHQEVDVSDGHGDSLPWLQRAAAVVTMAGYNTLSEALAARRKALAVPRAGPSAEQRMRARLFADRRLIAQLEPEALAPKRLAEELLALLAHDGIPDGSRIPLMDGAQRAAAFLVEAARTRKEELSLVSCP